MKPEIKRRNLTDTDRDAILKLVVCGLTTDEIMSIVNSSRSAVSYVRQAHHACLNKDWSALQRMSQHNRAVVDWAMRVTGTDRVFAETFPKEPEPEQSVAEPAVEVPDQITREDILAMYGTLQDIRSLLTDIRDMLK